MNRYQQEVEQQLLQDEDDCQEQLKKNYKSALKDIRAKIKEMTKDPNNLEKIKQVRYQLMLDAQIETILNKMGDKNVTDLTDYLDTMYHEGYLGCLYGMNKEGVGMVLRLDEKKIESVINMDTAGLKFSERLYDNVDKLKRNFKTELARGFSTGSDYLTIASNLALYGEADLKRAYRIVRTEGHRVQSVAKMDAMKEARKIGADVVKQWDSTVDRKTRASHRELDGQMRELDEDFISPISGAPAMYPGGFGIAAEDINCRCALLQRARWALTNGEEGHKYSRFEKDIISMQSTSYLGWKNKYSRLMKASEIKNPAFAKAQADFAKQLSESAGSPRHVGLMRMYSECTTYKEDFSLKHISAYDPASDMVLYNPKHPDFNIVDLTDMQAHEISHRMDFIEYESYNNKAMSEAFAQTREYAIGNIDELQQLFDSNDDYYNDQSLSDIFMTLTENRMSLLYGHADADIAHERDAVMEIFADISTMDVLGNENISVLTQKCPKIMEVYLEMVAWTK